MMRSKGMTKGEGTFSEKESTRDMLLGKALVMCQVEM